MIYNCVRLFKGPIHYNDKKLSLSGNATIKLFPTDSNKISFKILNKDSYLINYKENNISIFQDINEMKSNIKYPTVYFYIPRSYMNYEVELNKNGDIIFSEDFVFNSLNITLNGNGDFSNTNKMKISNFNIVLNGNGDVKINNIISDKINCNFRSIPCIVFPTSKIRNPQNTLK